MMIAKVPDLGDDLLDALAWRGSDSEVIRTSWAGEKVVPAREFSVSLLYCTKRLYIRFDLNQAEELVIANNVDVSSKTIGLWERDVCEIFIAPDRNEPRKYFEFEVAPTGEWVDLAIDVTSGERVTDPAYSSGMEVAARIEEDRVLMAMKIPWEAFRKKPKAGDIWLGNVFRCVGRAPNRGYLAWSPTMTEVPNFHVPDRFGQMIFGD